jgi:hypothetical protein
MHETGQQGCATGISISKDAVQAECYAFDTCSYMASKATATTLCKLTKILF